MPRRLSPPKPAGWRRVVFGAEVDDDGVARCAAASMPNARAPVRQWTITNIRPMRAAC